MCTLLEHIFRSFQIGETGNEWNILDMAYSYGINLQSKNICKHCKINPGAPLSASKEI
jgi:superfamily II helicase